MILTDYRIEAGDYVGPVDLLLYLVRRHEVDLCAVSLSAITSDFLAWVDVPAEPDYELMGEFAVVGTTLLEIKSRDVLPKAPELTEDETTADPGDDLIARLLEYRRYKEAAKLLDQRAAEWLERFPRLSSSRPAAPRDCSEDRIREVELWDLVSALSRIVRMPLADREISIRMEETPIEVYQARIRERTGNEGRVAFSSFFEGEKIQARIVGIFLAILELIRHEGYRAEQPAEYGEIWILPPLSHIP